jgi:hypothetical protein
MVVDPDCISKFVPLRVSVALDPLLSVAGVIEVRVGGGVGPASTVNLTPRLVPFSVVTVTSRSPGAAPGEIAKVALRDVSLTTLTPDTVIPLPLTETVVVRHGEGGPVPAAP